MSKNWFKKPLIIWNVMFRAAVGPQTIWCLIIRHSASATQLKNISLIKPPYLNSISFQMRSLPPKVLKMPRKSQEAFYFKVNLITKLEWVFPPISLLNFKPLVFFSHQFSYFNSGRKVTCGNTKQLTASLCYPAGFRKVPFWIIQHCG